MALLPILTLWAPALLGLCAAAEPVPRATFTQVTDFGDNPTGAEMWIYVPKNLAARPAVVAAVHWCHGSASDVYQDSYWAIESETYGYITVYPQTPYSDKCWDVASDAALTHGGGGDSNSIANMVNWVLDEYSGDASKVFSWGVSSGAMMTNVLAAVYPDVFAAGIAYAGVPAGCFASADDIADFWNSTCATGETVDTQQQWVKAVRAMYPGYTGAYPKMQVYHGTADTTLYPQNYYEEVKEWTGLLGYSATPVETVADYPRSPYTKYVYGDRFQSFLGEGMTHSIDTFYEEDLAWFGFTSTVTPTASASATATATTTTTASQPSGTRTAGEYGQCGGLGWTGATQCASPYVCTWINDWYSQCL